MSLSVLRHVEASVAERDGLSEARQATRRRSNGEDEAEAPSERRGGRGRCRALTPERVAELEAAEEFLLTVTDAGFGKRSSAYDYRVTGRGGQGIANIT